VGVPPQALAVRTSATTTTSDASARSVFMVASWRWPFFTRPVAVQGSGLFRREG